MLTSRNPYTQSVQAEYPEHTSEQIQEFLSASVEAFFQWSYLSFSERGKYLLSVGELLKSRREELARISTEEMGMLFSDALLDIDKSIANIAYFVHASENLLTSEKYEKAEVMYQPLGTLLVIAPWNFPYNQ
jgi:succinate-semialdehyde dehydrogenase/glutarate-semialdehyde dehydrogenase